jgi:hypothetical protein
MTRKSETSPDEEASMFGNDKTRNAYNTSAAVQGLKIRRTVVANVHGSFGWETTGDFYVVIPA